MSSTVETCALCPRLCRHACPVATTTGREAAVPANIGGVLLAWRRGHVTDADALEAATLCVDCGQCQDACHLHQPLPDALRKVRRKLGAQPAVKPLSPVEGDGRVVAIETDERAWASALADKLGEPVARLYTTDGFGIAMRGGPGWDERVAQLRSMLDDRDVVVASGDVAAVLAEAGVHVTWLHDRVEGVGPVAKGCGHGTSLRCCGAAEPLRSAHPADAARMAKVWRDRTPGCVGDARCASHLREQGLDGADVVDWLLAQS